MADAVLDAEILNIHHTPSRSACAACTACCAVSRSDASRRYPAGSHQARGFYGALLDQKVYWEHTMQAEKVVRFELPTNQTDGVELANKVRGLVQPSFLPHIPSVCHILGPRHTHTIATFFRPAVTRPTTFWCAT